MEPSLFQAAIQGLQNLFNPYVFLAILVGVSIGTFTAVAPQGMGTPLAYSILLPFVVRWQPITAIALLIGVSSVSAICAAYLPVLFGIPEGNGKGYKRASAGCSGCSTVEQNCWWGTSSAALKKETAFAITGGEIHGSYEEEFL